MDDWYELKDLAGVNYIEYQNENSEWMPVAAKLTIVQSKVIEAFLNAQHEQLRKLLKAFVDEVEQ
jgi:hypothetical protein